VATNELDVLDIFSLLISAAIHDFEHPGLNNNFLEKSRHPLAIKYNDISILENHHIAASFKIMQ